MEKANEIEKKIHYIINIASDETPIYVSQELQPGTVTVMIMARTLMEAEQLYRTSTAEIFCEAR